MNFIKASRVYFGKNITFRNTPESFIDSNRHGCDIEIMGSLVWVIDKKDKTKVSVIPMGNISYFIPAFKAGQLDAHIEKPEGPIVTPVAASDVEATPECPAVETVKKGPIRRSNPKGVAK